MGIDAEDVLVCIWRFLRFFINTTHFCAQEHPLVSSTFVIIFLCYVFFDILLQHLPFLVFVAILLRFFWSSEQQESSPKPAGKEKEKPESKKETTRDISSFRRQKSRRTYFSSFSKDREIQALTVSSSHKNDDKLDVVLEGNENETEPETAIVEREVFAAVNGERKSDEENDDDDKAVLEWTEDDQRNFDDLGISEIERNRRLESLIAKRRARKLEKARVVAVVAPIVVVAARESPASLSSEGSRIPGSAPSVLAAGKNPFDIPYDPTEEKPDLTAGSFQEEFAAGIQKEGLNSYCRHESFCWGGFGFEPIRGLNKHSENEELMKQVFGESEGTKSNTNTNTTQTPNPSSIAESESQDSQQQCLTQSLDSDTSLNSEITNNIVVISEPDQTPNNDVVTEIETGQTITEHSETNSSSSSSIEASSNNRSVESIAETTSPTANDDNISELSGAENLASHTPSYSIASDMQVEVSELGSPPLTIGNASPIEGDSLSFDEELERGHLNFDMDSLNDDISRAMRSAMSSSAGEKKQKSAMEFAEKLSSHPFFESAYKESQKTLVAISEAPEENVTIDDTRNSGAEFMDKVEDQAKQEDNSINEEAMDNLAVPSEDTDLGSNEHIEEPIITEDIDLAVAIDDHHEEEDTRDEEYEEGNEASCVEGSKIDQSVSRQESFLVNKSSPSSPITTPIGRVTANDIFSSNLDRPMEIEVAINSNLINELTARDDSETLPDGVFFMEPSTSEKISDESES